VIIIFVTKKCDGAMVMDLAPQNGGEVFKVLLLSSYVLPSFLGVGG
jgi:hypothetical protein